MARVDGAGCGGRGLCRCRRDCFSCRQLDDELTAPIDPVALRTDRTSMRRDQAADDGEPQAQPASGPIQRLGALNEGVEHRPEHLAWDADPLVPDAEYDGAGTSAGDHRDL